MRPCPQIQRKGSSSAAHVEKGVLARRAEGAVRVIQPLLSARPGIARQPRRPSCPPAGHRRLGLLPWRSCRCRRRLREGVRIRGPGAGERSCF